MAQIEPFRGIRYDFARFRAGDLSPVVAPPYDVLSPADKAGLLAQDKRNIVAVDLPVVPADQAGPDEAYAQAAETFARWQADGTLIREPSPAIYAASQTFDHAGQSHTRRGFIARLRLEEFGQGKVHAHEETFSGPKADRLKLTQACRANLSQVFVLLAAGKGVIDDLYAGLSEAGDAAARLGGVYHRLWIVSDEVKVAALAEAVRDADVFIADGHHRYTTSLNYRKWLIERDGPLPADHPANYVSCALVSLEEPGLLVLPTHRVVRGLAGFSIADFKAATYQAFAWQEGEIEPVNWDEALREAGDHAIGVTDGASRQRFVLRPKDPDLLAGLDPNRSPAWRRLDVAILHRYLLDTVLRPRFGGPATRTEYLKDAAAADAATLGDPNSVAFILRPTPVQAVRAVCTAGELMPHKSTYFYPKLATGLVVHSLADC